MVPVITVRQFSLFLPSTLFLLFIDFFAKTLSFNCCLDLQLKYSQNQSILPKSCEILYLPFWELYKSEANLLESIACNYYRDQSHFYSLRHDATEEFKFTMYATQSYSWVSCHVSFLFHWQIHIFWIYPSVTAIWLFTVAIDVSLQMYQYMIQLVCLINKIIRGNISLYIWSPDVFHANEQCDTPSFLPTTPTFFLNYFRTPFNSISRSNGDKRKTNCVF